MDPEVLTGTARYVATLDDWNGDARVYAVQPPAVYNDAEGVGACTDLVIVSAVVTPYSGRPETYIFPAAEDDLGSYTVLDYGELEGSFQGALDHAGALAGAGYQLLEVAR